MTATATFAGEIAVLGIGETPYREDWRRARAGQRPDDNYGYAQRAFATALADSGLVRDDIDGLVVGHTLSYERTAEVLGLNVRWAGVSEAALTVAGAVLQAATAIVTGQAERVALVYGNDQRTVPVSYGGDAAAFSDQFLSYAYYAPWGFTSQGALYALMTRRYMELYGMIERDLGEVAVAQRMFAALNDNAIMRAPMGIEDYLASRYIVEPLRLFDYCIINDGGVALILTSRDYARGRSANRPTVILRGAGRSDLNVDATSLRPRLMDFYRPAHQRTAQAVYDNAGCAPQDIDVLQIYDSFSCHVPNVLAGFGFCPDDDLGPFLRSGALRPGGSLPVNTSGGHLSESYMQGWNHQIETVRQLRGEAGARQVPDARLAQYVSDVCGKTVSLIYEATR